MEFAVEAQKLIGISLEGQLADASLRSSRKGRPAALELA